jgi:hypothetical protein
MSASPSIPPPAEEPDPSTNTDWDPSPGESISGTVHDREEIETRYGPRAVLSISSDGKITRVPCFRQHLRELLALNDPRPADGIAISYFGPEPGGKKERYAMRVVKSDRPTDRDRDPDSLLDAEPSETAKLSRAINAPLGDEEGD